MRRSLATLFNGPRSISCSASSPGNFAPARDPAVRSKAVSWAMAVVR